jgi:uncharacterized protein (DUF427 family)
VDVLQSSREVRVEINGIEMARTNKARLMFETGLPVRTYIPKTDVRLEYLEPSDLVSACPYKVLRYTTFFRAVLTALLGRRELLRHQDAEGTEI